MKVCILNFRNICLWICKLFSSGTNSLTYYTMRLTEEENPPTSMVFVSSQSQIFVPSITTQVIDVCRNKCKWGACKNHPSVKRDHSCLSVWVDAYAGFWTFFLSTRPWRWLYGWYMPDLTLKHVWHITTVCRNGSVCQSLRRANAPLLLPVKSKPWAQKPRSGLNNQILRFRLRAQALGFYR